MQENLLSTLDVQEYNKKHVTHVSGSKVRR